MKFYEVIVNLVDKINEYDRRVVVANVPNLELAKEVAKKAKEFAEERLGEDFAVDVYWMRRSLEDEVPDDNELQEIFWFELNLVQTKGG